MFNNLELTADEDLNFFVYNMEITVENNLIIGNNLADRILYFVKYVRNLNAGGYTLLESIVEFCNKHDLEYDDAVKLITPELKSDIYLEAVQSNQIKDTTISNIGL